MPGTIYDDDALKVFIGANDHPPPHVHVYHGALGWLARFRFSYLSDQVELYRFKRRAKRPLMSELNDAQDIVQQHLNDCRDEWWNTIRTTGLVNKRLESRPANNPDSVQTRVRKKSSVGTVAVTGASYVPSTGKLKLILANGRKLDLTPGLHHEEFY